MKPKEEETCRWNLTVKIILSQKQSLEAELIEKERLKALNIKRLDQIASLNAEIITIRNNIPIADTIKIIKTVETGPRKYIQVPFKNKYNDRYINLTTYINDNGTWGFDIYQPLDLTITSGQKRTGFFKTEPTVFVDTPNPYVTINDIQYVNINEKKLKWWQQSLITIIAWECVKFGVFKAIGN